MALDQTHKYYNIIYFIMCYGLQYVLKILMMVIKIGYMYCAWYNWWHVSTGKQFTENGPHIFINTSLWVYMCMSIVGLRCGFGSHYFICEIIKKMFYWKKQLALVLLEGSFWCSYISSAVHAVHYTGHGLEIILTGMLDFIYNNVLRCSVRLVRLISCKQFLL